MPPHPRALHGTFTKTDFILALTLTISLHQISARACAASRFLSSLISLCQKHLPVRQLFSDTKSQENFELAFNFSLVSRLWISLSYVLHFHHHN